MRESSVMLLTVARALSKFIERERGRRRRRTEHDTHNRRGLQAIYTMTKAPYDSPLSWFTTMANTRSATKRAKQTEKRRVHNAALRSEFRTAIKKVKKAIAAGNKEEAQSVYRASVSTLDSIADKGVFHKNKSARHKSRFARALKAMA
jgi:small subunit ribosomal protein S20